MKKLNLIILLCFVSLLTFGQLTVSVPTMTAMPGQTVLVPVTLSGASATGTPISSANIHITYDTAVLSYVNTINFYSAMPASQWYYSGNFNSDLSCNSFTASANWVHSSLATQAIPDGTTLYEIQFLYKGGNTALNLCIYEFTDVNYDFIPATPVNGAVNVPSLTGPASVCGEGSTGNIYTTDPGMTNYQWTVTGGTITSGGSSGDHTVTVTWPFAGNHLVSVTYNSNVSASLPVSVYPTSPVSVSIAVSQTSVCAGTSVTFTATPENGGANPSYQWKKNGSNVGNNSPVYIYTPANNDVVTCVLTSDVTCSSGNPSTSNAITMSVTANVNVSVTIAASQNPVAPGTTVTFTATPVNGGPTPVYQWKVNGLNVGTNAPAYSYIPLNGDQIFCILTTSLTCYNNQIATSNVITMTVSASGQLLVTLPNIKAMPGDILYFPVKLKGASSTGIPVSSANIQISYDPAVLHYDTLVNFYSAMPSSQWFFSGNNSMVSANWMESSLQTLAIPDSTTLFEIKFTYLGGDGTLPFVVKEFTDAVFEFVPTSGVNGGVMQLVPNNSSIGNVTVPTGQDTCFNAVQQLTVAGNGKTFEVMNGGNATLIAGERINILPGTNVSAGGYMHAYITLDGSYCGLLPNPVVSLSNAKLTVNSMDSVSSGERKYRLYPNPTHGKFTLSTQMTTQERVTLARMYSLSGEEVFFENFDNEVIHVFDIQHLSSGIYFLKVISTERTEILKIVKL